MAFNLRDSKDGIAFTGAQGTNSPISFTLLGGKYAFAASAAVTSQSLNFVLPDQSTTLAVGSSTTLTTAAGTATVDLPPGTYQWIITSNADVQGFLQKIPYRPN